MGRKRRVREQSSLPPEVEAGLRAVIRELTDTDDEHRRDWAARVLAQGVPAFLHLVIDRLVEVLGRSPEGLARRAGDSLVVFGQAAVLSLQYHVIKSSDEQLQVRLIGVLDEIGRGLPPERRAQLQVDLALLAFGLRTPAVLEAFARASDRLRPPPADPAAEEELEAVALAGCRRKGRR